MRNQIAAIPWRRLVCVGQATADTVVVLDRQLAPGDQTTGMVTRQPGGTAAIVAQNASSVGLSDVVFSGHAGSDAAGRRSLDALTRAGVQLGDLVQTPRSPEVIVLIDRDGERTMVAHRETPPWERLNLLVGADDLVFFEGWHLFETPSFERIVLAARRAGSCIAVDPCSATRADDPIGHGSRLAALAHIVIANQAEAAAYRLEPPDPAVELLVVHAGPEPTRVWIRGRCTSYPVPRRMALDTTGAGDAFAGGLLTMLAAGAGTGEAVGEAHRLAGQAVERIGAMEGVSHASPVA